MSSGWRSPACQILDNNNNDAFFVAFGSDKREPPSEQIQGD